MQAKPTAVPQMLRRPGPQAELEKVLDLPAHMRKECLIKLAEKQPQHGPTWMELAEEHLKARRKEEAIHAAREALQRNMTLFKHFSPALRKVCQHLEPPGQGSQDPSAPTRPHGPVATPVTSNQSRARGRGPLAIQIAKIKAGDAPQRRQKLEDLTRKHPQEGEAWLALAEENIEARRVEEALAGIERALALDPQLERMFSRKLQTAYRFHKAGIAPPGISEEHARKYTPRSQRTPPRRRKPRAPDPRWDKRARRGEPPDEALLARYLDLALKTEDRKQRVEALRGLREISPHNEDVLYHFAYEAAVAGEVDEARLAGKQLKHLAPERYQQLYEAAEEYWRTHEQQPASDASDADTVFFEEPAPPPTPIKRITRMLRQRSRARAPVMYYSRVAHATGGPPKPPYRRLLGGLAIGLGTGLIVAMVLGSLM